MKVLKRRTRLWLYAASIAALAVWVGTGLADSTHQTRQNRAIPLGTSGGSIEHMDFPYCCGGTLGGLVEDMNGTKFILSNNHILARTNRGAVGEGVVQPGLLDVQCQPLTEDVAAELSAYVPIVFDSTNNVDAAIAQVHSGKVMTDGTILDIGTLSSTTLAASLGLKVKKSGRTTGLTSGEVTAIDVTANVRYPEKCGRGGGETATFVNQIRITPGDFSAGGDSGSVIVEDVGDVASEIRPQAVGLLFAGSSSSTLANPIDAVLTALGVAMVGGTPPDPLPTGSISGTVTNAADNMAIEGATVQVDNTNHSATTVANGSYTISDVPRGVNYTVIASAGGFVSQTTDSAITVIEGETTTNVNFALTESTEPTAAIVDCINYTASGGRNGDKDLHIEVTILDDFNNYVEGASVSVTVNLDGEFFGSATATTDSSGSAKFKGKNAPNGVYQTDVTNVVASGLSFINDQPPDGFANNQFDKGFDTSASFCSVVDPSGTVSKFIRPDPDKVQEAIVVKRLNENYLFATSNDVVGVGVGAVNGEPVIEVYLISGDARARGRLPARLASFQVRPVITGEFVAGLECTSVE